MNKVLFALFLGFCPLLLKAQNPEGNYNPYLGSGTINPQPLWPIEAGGTGVVSFNIGNSGSDQLEVFTGHQITLTITLSYGEPDNVNPLLAVGGTSSGLFSWSYNSGTYTYTATQIGTIPANSAGNITIAYKVTQNSTKAESYNGFNVNLTPAPYEMASNTPGDDAVSSYTWTEIRDFGDAPVSYGSADHIIDYANYIGSTVDGESANQPSAAADADDANGIDDEDGVTFPTLTQGATVIIPVSVVGGAYLNVWIDWNGDGDFNDTGERIVMNSLKGDETVNLSITVPVNAITSAPTFARFRFGPRSTTPTYGSTGSATFGEVEDYQITIECAIPATPTVGTIIQPTCDLATGSVTLNSLPSKGTWTLTLNPGGVTTTGTGTSTTISGLSAGTYTYTVTNSVGCTSLSSNNAVINTQPITPSVPVVGTITQPTCTVETGSVVLSSLPAGDWTITRTPGGVTTTGNGVATTISDLPEGTYSFTVTNDDGCISPPTLNVVIAAQPESPSSPVASVDCSLGFNKAVITVTSPLGASLEYSLDGGTYQSGTIFSNVANGSHTIIVRNSSGCTTTGVSFSVSCGCVNGPTITLSSITGSTCGTLPVTVSGNTFGGNATSVSITENGAGTVSPVTTSASPFAFTYTPAAGDPGTTVTITLTTNNPSGAPCAAATATYTLSVNANPSAPAVGTITQPTCLVSTGSVVLNGLPSSGTWTLTRNPEGITTSGTGTSTTISNLLTGTYNFTVTNDAGCISGSSTNVIIAAQPATPFAPAVGVITHPTCTVSTGSVVLSGLPSSGTWTLTRYPGTVTTSGTGTSTTLTTLATGIYNYTVTNAAGCVSSLSSNVVIDAQPLTPSAPIVGTITQPTCAVSTGSVVFSGLPSIGTWTINPGVISGTGTSTIVSGLAISTYNFTVTNSDGCTSVASVNVVINAQPATPSPPVVGTITHPTCSVATGSVVLSGLSSSETWTLTRTPGGSTTTGTGTSTTISGLSAGTYTYTVTSSAGCTSSASGNVVINAQPESPASPTQKIDCTLGFGKADVTVISPTEIGLEYRLDGGAFQSGTSFTNVVNGSHTITVMNLSGCTTTGVSFSVSCGCINGPTVTLTSTSGSTCGTTAVTVSGNTFGGNATSVIITENGSGTVNPATTSAWPFTFTYTPVAGDAGTTVTITVTTDNPLGAPCAAATATYTLTVNANPAAPAVGTITQPTCTVLTGSVVLNSLPASGTWTLTRTPGGVTTGTGTNTTISGLAAGAYTFTVTNANNCISGSSTNVVINTQPATPSAPVVGTVTPPTCTISTGSVPLSGLPSTGSWTLTCTPDGVTTTGSGTSTTISTLAEGTYTYTVTNSVGCTSSASGNVFIPAQPATPSSPAVGAITHPTCAVSTGSVLLSGLPSSGIWTLTLYPGTVTTSGTGTSTTITGLVTGTYNFTVTNSDGCTSVASVNVVINTQPVTPSAPIVGTITQPTCAVSTGSVVFSGLPSIGTWTINPGVISGTGTSTIVSGLATGTLNFTVTNSDGCTSVASVNVVINAQPATPSPPVVGTITHPTCSVATGSVVLSGLPSSGTWTLTRTPGGLITTGTGTNTTISGLAAGTHNYTVTNAAGCTSVASANVVINAQPVTSAAPTIGTITQTTCAVATGSVVLSSLPAGTWTLTRTPGGTTTGTGISTIITGLAAGTYTYTVSNAATCVSVASGNVVVNTQPATPTAPAVGIITQPTCAVATGSVVLSGLPAGNWTINPGSITGSTASTTISGLAAGTYTYTVTNAAGCTSEASSNVVIPAQPATPTVVITNPAAVCSPSKVDLTAPAVTAGSTSGLTYTYWTIAAATIAYATPATAGAGTYYIKGTTASGCYDIKPVTVTVKALPAANAGTGGSECDLNFKFNAVASIGAGTWTVTTGTGTASFAPDANTATATVTVSEYGTYTFTWTEVSNNCSKSSTITVNFNQQPVTNAGTGGNNCGPEFFLEAVPSVGIGTWTKTAGSGPATFTPNANVPNAKVTVSAYGLYTFTWTEVNGACSNSASVNVNFLQVSAANAGTDGSECDLDFILNAIPGTGAGAGLWTRLSGPGNAIFSPDPNQHDAKVTVDQFGTYDFAWTEENSTCQSTDMVRVVFHNLPSISAGKDTIICNGETIQFQEQGVGSFLWAPAELVSNPDISDPVAAPVTTTTFTVTLTDQFGCKNSDDVIVEVRENPVANAGPDQVLEYLPGTTMDAELAHDYETGNWSLISGTGEIFDATYSKTSISGLSLDENKILWTVTNGVCPASSDTVTIIVHDLIIPTLITPNMDGKNDYFVLRGIETLGKTELVIFDRRGAQVYRNSNYDNKWNGVDYNENPLPDDTYFFVLKTENGKSISGYIVIRR